MTWEIALSDVLYMALILLVLILCYAAIQLVGILKNVKITSDKIREVAEIINEWAWKPVQFLMKINRKFHSIQDFVEGKIKPKKKTTKRKRKKSG